MISQANEHEKGFLLCLGSIAYNFPCISHLDYGSTAFDSIHTKKQFPLKKYKKWL